MTHTAETSLHRQGAAAGPSYDRIKKFFEPRSIVVVGAAERTLYTQCTVQNSERFKGASIHLVNRRGVPVFGRPAATSCVEIGQEIDTAFIQVPAAAVLDAVDDAYQAGIRNVVLLSSGFAEGSSAGRALQDRLAARVQELDMMLLGPNHVGFLNLAHGISAFALPAPGVEAGNLAVLSQSGAIAMEIARFGERQDVRMSHLITLGNEAVMSSADALLYTVECPQTKAILMFMEGIKHPERFAEAARRAAELGKPIIVYKAGATELAAKSAAAHTGALVGDDKITNAVFRDLGIIRVSSLEDLVVTGKLAASIGKRPIRGVGVVSASGGANDIIADVAEPFGVTLAQFSEPTKQAIIDTIPDDFITAQNPFDLTGSSVRDRTLWKSVTGIIGRDPSVDLIICVGGLVADESPQPKDLMVAEALNALDCPYVYTTTLTTEIPPRTAAVMKECGFNLVSTGVVPTLRALGAIAAWSDAVDDARRANGQAEAIPTPDLGERSGAWSEFRARSVLSAAGVPVLESVLATSADEAVAAAASMGGPVALKIMSPDILHKSDIGGVALSVSGEPGVRDAYEKVLQAGKRHASPSRIEGVLVSPMRSGGIELIVGVTRDEQWGLMLVLGLGGIFVEVLGDSVILPLPTSADRVKQALQKLRGAALLQGVRGTRAADLDALSGVIARIGAVAQAFGDRLESLEVNPLVVDGADIVALDALIIESAHSR